MAKEATILASLYLCSFGLRFSNQFISIYNCSPVVSVPKDRKQRAGLPDKYKRTQNVKASQGRDRETLQCCSAVLLVRPRQNEQSREYYNVGMELLPETEIAKKKKNYFGGTDLKYTSPET